MKKTLCLTVLILIMVLMARAWAQMDVPASLQVALFYKIFDFDQNLSEIANQQVVIGIFYDPDDPQSSQARSEIKANFLKLSDKKISGKTIVIKEIIPGEGLQGVDIVYVTPGNDFSINEIVKECQKYKILSISGVAQYAREGLAIAIGLNDQKPKIIINRAGAESCGAKLSSKIMSLAQIL